VDRVSAHLRVPNPTIYPPLICAFFITRLVFFWLSFSQYVFTSFSPLGPQRDRVVVDLDRMTARAELSCSSPLPGKLQAFCAKTKAVVVDDSTVDHVTLEVTGEGPGLPGGGSGGGGGNGGGKLRRVQLKGRVPGKSRPQDWSLAARVGDKDGTAPGALLGGEWGATLRAT
jgi:hypothetical protein